MFGINWVQHFRRMVKHHSYVYLNDEIDLIQVET